MKHTVTELEGPNESRAALAVRLRIVRIGLRCKYRLVGFRCQ